MSLEISLLISTYQRPQHLRRSLVSVAEQRCPVPFEVVVTDDGSEDETHDVVRRFADEADFPVKFTTQPHDGFRVAQSRNLGIRACRGNYLVFTDGDCLLPPNFLEKQLNCRMPGRVIVGDSYRLDRADSESITESDVVSGQFLHRIPAKEKTRLRRKAVRAWMYNLIRHPTLPRLTGCNFAAWRSDLDTVGGFDENFVGWGLEDRDLQMRLSERGLRFKSSLWHTATYHLWHAPHPTMVRNNVGSSNLDYFQRKHARHKGAPVSGRRAA